LRQINQPLAHYAVDRRDRAALDHSRDGLALSIIELRGLARRFAASPSGPRALNRFFATPRSCGASKSWRNGIGTDMANLLRSPRRIRDKLIRESPTSQNFRDLVLRVSRRTFDEIQHPAQRRPILYDMPTGFNLRQGQA
jgi:hypothetical protein